jgi:hypothetical protein
MLRICDIKQQKVHEFPGVHSTFLSSLAGMSPTFPSTVAEVDSPNGTSEWECIPKHVGQVVFCCMGCPNHKACSTLFSADCLQTVVTILLGVEHFPLISSCPVDLKAVSQVYGYLGIANESLLEFVHYVLHTKRDGKQCGKSDFEAVNAASQYSGLLAGSDVIAPYIDCDYADDIKYREFWYRHGLGERLVTHCTACDDQKSIANNLGIPIEILRLLDPKRCVIAGGAALHLAQPDIPWGSANDVDVFLLRQLGREELFAKLSAILQETRVLHYSPAGLVVSAFGVPGVRTIQIIRHSAETVEELICDTGFDFNFNKVFYDGTVIKNTRSAALEWSDRVCRGSLQPLNRERLSKPASKGFWMATDVRRAADVDHASQNSEPESLARNPTPSDSGSETVQDYSGKKYSRESPDFDVHYGFADICLINKYALRHRLLCRFPLCEVVQHTGTGTLVLRITDPDKLRQHQDQVASLHPAAPRTPLITVEYPARRSTRVFYKNGSDCDLTDTLPCRWFAGDLSTSDAVQEADLSTSDAVQDVDLSTSDADLSTSDTVQEVDLSTSEKKRYKPIRYFLKRGFFQ